MKTLQTFAFLIDPARADATLEAVAGAFRRSEADETERQEAFFDTFDWRLHGSDLRLILESRAERGKAHRRTLCLEGRDGALHLVDPAEPPGFAWDLPEGRLREQLEPVVEMRRLLPLMEVSFHTRTWAVLGEEEKTVARLRLETAEVRAPENGEPSPLAPRLYVDPVRGYDTADDVRDFLHMEVDLRFVDRPLFDEAAAAVGLDPGSYSSKVQIELHAEDTAVEAARHIFLELLDTMRANEEGTRDDLDSEFLHDFRVAVRRTRAGLSQIKRVFPEDRVEHFKREFSWLGKLTGPTRDLDVYLLKMPEYRRDLPPEVGADLDPLTAFLEARQRAEQKKLAAGLGSARYGKLVADWRSFLAKPLPKTSERPSAEGPVDTTPQNAGRPVVEVASERIWKIYRRILRQGGAIDDASPADSLHDVRLLGKKLRYLMEFFRSLYPKSEIEASIKELKKLQGNLGDFNDYEVQQVKMAAFAEEMAQSKNTPASTLLAMGRLQSRLAEGQALERRAFAQKFERFASEKNQRRFRRLFKDRA